MSFLAWVGLGADGLSSSAYGPDEAYRALGAHTHLAILLVAMTAITIIVISVAYSDLIEHFPGGGGGYLVASKILGPRAGLTSGSALLIDYVLTIAVSVASGCDAVWSFLPPDLAPYKLMVEFGILIFLTVINLRGVKESVTFLMPIFILFILLHLFVIIYVIASYFTGIPMIFHEASVDFHTSASTIGLMPLVFILLRAYSMGGGTYTGIEAVSNGMSMLREPRVKTGKRTMLLMCVSLTITAAGILFGYMLTNSVPTEGKTMNAVLLQNLFGMWAIGKPLIVITLISEAVLLFVAAQTGFLGGPRVLSNMALDSWMPHRFAQLSNRLVTKNGVLLMGLAAMGMLYYTHGNITMLVIMYSINVFLTFTLTELGMVKLWNEERRRTQHWKRKMFIHVTGLIMCASILCITLYEKFLEGGWVTAIITIGVVIVCLLIHGHYDHVHQGFQQLDDVLAQAVLPELPDIVKNPLDKKARTAVLPLQSFSGFGMHHLLAIMKWFPGDFKNIIFVSVGVIDSGSFKGMEEISELQKRVQGDLEKYVRSATQFGLRADYRMEMSTEAIPTVEKLCREINKEFPNSIVFTGKLIFRQERWYQRILHNESALTLQRRLHLDGIPTMVLPIRA